MVGQMGWCWMCWLLGNKTKVKLARFDQKPQISAKTTAVKQDQETNTRFSDLGDSIQDLCRIYAVFSCFH